MFELYATGNYTLERLANTMNSLGFATRNNKPLRHNRCQSILSNHFYYGLIYYWGELCEASHEPIITHLQNLRAKLTGIDSRINKLIDVYLEGNLTKEEYTHKKEKLVNEKKELQETIQDFADEGNIYVRTGEELRNLFNRGTLYM